MTTARDFLRSETAALHDQVDAAFARYDIATTDGYRAMLCAHARVLPAIEAALEGWRDTLPDWPERKRSAALFADLAALGVEPARIAAAADFRIDSAAAALGTAYVLEGSRLGGRVLARRLPPAAPRAYLAAPQARGSWPRLMRALNRRVKTTDQRETASEAAKDAFLAFKRAALESAARHA